MRKENREMYMVEDKPNLSNLKVQVKKLVRGVKNVDSNITAVKRQIFKSYLFFLHSQICREKRHRRSSIH